MDSEAEPVRVPISKRLVLINTASTIATRLLTVGVFAWVIQHLMKRIPEEELALLPVVLSLAFVLPLLQTILVGGLSRHVTEAYARNDLADVTRIVSSQFPFLFVGGLLILIVGSIAIWNIEMLLVIPPDLIGEARFMGLLIVARISVTMVLVPFNTGLFADQRFMLRNAIEIVGSLLRILLMVSLILGVGPRVEWVVVAQVVSQMLVLFFSTVISIRLIPALRFNRESFDWETSKRVMSFGGWEFGSQSANAILRAADAPILNLFSTPVAVNNFFLGSFVETNLRELAHRASVPLLPALTAMYALDQSARLASAFLRGGRLLLWMHMFATLPLILFGYDLFSLYLGAEYPAHVDAATVMILLLISFPLSRPTLIFSRIAYARGDIRAMSICSILSQLGNLALTLVLVGVFKLGAIGSAWSTLIVALIIHPFAFWPLALRTLNISGGVFIKQTLWPGIIPTIAGTIVAIASTYFVDSAIGRIVFGFPAYAIAYIAVIALVLKPADRADLNQIRKRLGLGTARSKSKFLGP